jgi:hypothetical protein
MKIAHLLTILTILSIAAPSALGQSSYDLFGDARADALGNSTTALPSAVGVQANPAALAPLRETTTLFYARQGFGLSALRYGASHAALPFDWGTASAGVSTFGFEDYREVHVSAGYARSLSLGTSRSLSVGTRVRYHHTSIVEYGSAGTVALNLGLRVALLHTLHLGVHATNLNGTSLVDREPLPRTLSVGVHYRALQDLRVLVDAFKDVRFPVSARAGLEVRPVTPLFLRIGITTKPVRFSGGAGIRVGPLDAHIAAEEHQELGWSPSASLRARW